MRSELSHRSVSDPEVSSGYDIEQHTINVCNDFGLYQLSQLVKIRPHGLSVHTKAHH